MSQTNQTNQTSLRLLATTAAVGALCASGLAHAAGKPAPKAKAKPAAKAPAKAAKPAPAPPAKKPLMVGPITLQGVIDVRAIFTDNAQLDAALPTTGLKTRYTGSGAGAGAAAVGATGSRRTLFRVSQASMQAMLPVATQWTLKTRLNFDLEGNPPIAGRMSQNFRANGSTIGVIYGFMHGMGVLGKGGDAKVGAFSLPFLHESNGPISTGKLTISSGAVSTAVKGTRVEGIEGHWGGVGTNTKGGVAVGLFNNADGYGGTAITAPATTGATNFFRLQDIQGDISTTGGDVDGDVGFYLDGHLESTKDLWQLDLGYFNNGGDENVAGAVNSHYVIAGGRVNLSPHFLLQAHFINGDSSSNIAAAGALPVNPDAEWTAWSLVASGNWEEHRLTVRYDDFNNEVAGVAGEQEDGKAWTVAYRRQLSPEQVLWLEYISPENSPTTSVGRTSDANDDLLQIAFQTFY